MAIAINRWKWVGLPDGVDVRFLETQLLTTGVATVSWPEGLNPDSAAFAMQAVLKSPPDINGNYAAWESLGLNGTRWDTKRGVNGAIVWDSWTRMPQIDMIQFYAAEIASIQRTMQTVMQHMRQPVIISAPREQAQQISAFQTQIANGTPYMVVSSDGFADVETKVLPTASGQEAAQLDSLRENMESVFKFALNALGISITPIKGERQTMEEIDQTDKPTVMIMLDGLDARRQAAAELSRIIGREITVVWNSDYITDTWNMEHNLRSVLSNPAAPNMVSKSAATASNTEEIVKGGVTYNE